MNARLLVGACLAFAASGCASAMPPPPDVASPPEAVLPHLSTPPAPPPAGTGLLVFDSVSGPASVARLIGVTRERGYSLGYYGPYGGWGISPYRGRAVTTASVCPQTPCAAYLPYGDYHVILESTENNRSAEFIVTSSDVPHALRASLDVKVPSQPTRTLGGVAFIAGAVAAGLGALWLTFPAAQSGQDGAGPFALTAGGAAVAVLGGILLLTGHPGATYDGQGTVWEIKSPAPAPAGGTPAGVTNL